MSPGFMARRLEQKAAGEDKRPSFLSALSGKKDLSQLSAGAPTEKRGLHILNVGKNLKEME